MTTHLAPNRRALPPPAAGLIRRAKVFLTAVALVAAILLVAAGSWPLKALVMLVFVRGLFASDVVAFQKVSRHRRSTQAHGTPAHRTPAYRTPAHRPQPHVKASDEMSDRLGVYPTAAAH